jgi:S-adenosylmethionine:diacylglycerol 3-amino-3-carboxypropyl transferase
VTNCTENSEKDRGERNLVCLRNLDRRKIMTTVKELEAQVAKLEGENAEMMKMMKETLELQRGIIEAKRPKGYRG